MCTGLRYVGLVSGFATGRLTVWACRAAWVVGAVAVVVAVSRATEGRSSGVGVSATVLLWGTVGASLVAHLVPSTASLTVIRVLAPLTVAGSTLTWAAGAGAWGALAVATTLLAGVLTFGADVGETFAQASAYGDERRFPLRPPAAMLLPVVVTWCVWAAAVLTGPLLLGARQWFAGTAVTLVAVGCSWLVLPRFHRLARRWLVLVPAGLVLHDHVVLAETLLVQRHHVAGLHLALADTKAVDLTGPCGGHAVEVRVHEMVTVVLAPTRRHERGRALHAAAALVAPTRPGRALAAAAANRLPVS